MDLFPEGGGFLLVEFGADDPDEAQRLAQQLIERLKQFADPPTTRLYTASEAPRRLANT